MKGDIGRLVREIVVIVQVGDDEIAPDGYMCENVYAPTCIKNEKDRKNTNVYGK